MDGIIAVVTNLVIPAAAVAATAVGLWLAHNYRRQMTLKLSQTRLEFYSRLWELTGVAAPTRLDGWGDHGYLRIEERRDLWAAMTDWYYSKGGGMLLTEAAKVVYLNVKHNLVCGSTDHLRPISFGPQVRSELGYPDDYELNDMARGILAIRLLSLLRTQLKSDLRVYGPTYYAGELREYEILFLKNSGVQLRSQAWAKAAGLESRWAPLTSWFRPAGERHGIKTSARPLTGLSPILDVGGTLQAPSSARRAIRNALVEDPDGLSNGG